MHMPAPVFDPFDGGGGFQSSHALLSALRDTHTVLTSKTAFFAAAARS